MPPDSDATRSTCKTDAVWIGRGHPRRWIVGHEVYGADASRGRVRSLAVGLASHRRSRARPAAETPRAGASAERAWGGPTAASPVGPHAPHVCSVLVVPRGPAAAERGEAPVTRQGNLVRAL